MLLPLETFLTRHANPVYLDAACQDGQAYKEDPRPHFRSRTMAYYRPEKRLEAVPLAGGRYRLLLRHQGNIWEREVGPGDLINVSEAAVLAEVTRSTIFNWIQSGQLPVHKLDPSAANEPEFAVLVRDVRKCVLSSERSR